MTDRVQLNEQDLDAVVGGAFIYRTHKNDDGSEYMTCEVEGDSTYFCSENAKRKISLFIVENNPGTLEEIVNYAKSNGLFW